LFIQSDGVCRQQIDITLVQDPIAVNVEFAASSRACFETAGQGEGIENIYASVTVYILDDAAGAFDRLDNPNRDSQHEHDSRRNQQKTRPVEPGRRLRLEVSSRGAKNRPINHRRYKDILPGHSSERSDQPGWRILVRIFVIPHHLFKRVVGLKSSFI
jgi:hypothetical protein